jgi:drug/metabolite transporter (DMT)-like permease
VSLPQGELAALGTACCWTVGALAFEAAGRRVGSLSLNLLRLLMAFVPLTLVGLIFHGRALPLDAGGHVWFWLTLSGFVGFTFGDLCLFRAFVVVGARTTTLISMSTAPVLAALIGWGALHDRLTALDCVGMAVTLAGVAWVVLERRGGDGGDHAHRRSGILLAIGAGVGQGVGLVLGKHGMGSYDAFGATQIRVLAGAVGFALLFIPIHWWPRVRMAMRDRPALARMALGAFFGPFLGVSLSLLAVQHTATGVAATIMALVPVFIIVPAMLIFHERVGPRAFLGAFVAVAGVALLFLQ